MLLQANQLVKLMVSLRGMSAGSAPFVPCGTNALKFVDIQSTQVDLRSLAKYKKTLKSMMVDSWNSRTDSLQPLADLTNLVRLRVTIPSTAQSLAFLSCLRRLEVVDISIFGQRIGPLQHLHRRERIHRSS